MKSSWTREIYDTEAVLGLWNHGPLADLGDAAILVDFIQRTNYWKALLPGAPVPILCERAKTYSEETGTRVRRLRRTRTGFVITYGIGMLTTGVTLHELAHIPSFSSAQSHGRAFLDAYLILWKQNARNVLYRALLAELGKRGVPVAQLAPAG